MDTKSVRKQPEILRRGVACPGLCTKIYPSLICFLKSQTILSKFRCIPEDFRKAIMLSHFVMAIQAGALGNQIMRFVVWIVVVFGKNNAAFTRSTLQVYFSENWEELLTFQEPDTYLSRTPTTEPEGFAYYKEQNCLGKGSDVRDLTWKLQTENLKEKLAVFETARFRVFLAFSGIQLSNKHCQVLSVLYIRICTHQRKHKIWKENKWKWFYRMWRCMIYFFYLMKKIQIT